MKKVSSRSNVVLETHVKTVFVKDALRLGCDHCDHCGHILRISGAFFFVICEHTNNEHHHQAIRKEVFLSSIFSNKSSQGN